ncbi:MAG: polysaccharide biosynthesis tyrosine autokinase [Phycisphaerae bacterium]|nr:polysaccharide biosynthesis tyrosine autokinase [Phycisphaerae bacterium]
MPAPSSEPRTSPAQAQGPRPAPGPQQAGGVSIDPVKLLQKYKYWLGAAGAVGVFLGGAFHLGMARVYPIWTSAAQFQAYPQAVEPGVPLTGDPQNKEGFDRFMQTQVRIIESDGVLTRVAENPALAVEAPGWVRSVVEGGRVNAAKALKKLKKRVNASILPGTSIIQVSAWDNNPAEAMALVRLVREAYVGTLRRQASQVNQPQTDALKRNIDAMGEEVTRIQRARDSLITGSTLESLNEANNATRQRLEAINKLQVEVHADLEGTRKQREMYEAEANAPAGVTYPEMLTTEIEREPTMAEALRQLAAYEARKKALLQMFDPSHREVRSIEFAIDAQQRSVDEIRERLLHTRFRALLESVRQSEAQLHARMVELQSERDKEMVRMAELSKAMAQVKDMDDQVRLITEERRKMQTQFDSLRLLDQLPTSNRIVVLQDERKPDEMTFPKLLITIPAGALLVLGFVGTLAVVRELVDQRVKGPGDIALIPRTRVAGWIPDAAQDPAGPGAVETAFRDRPRGAVAESFRQLRSSLGKRMQAAGHRSVLVLAAAPSSGGTTTAANLALACAGADQRVLLIDANFRRPALHRVFGLPEEGGLGDVLAQSRSLEQAVHKTGVPNLDVLTSGSRASRAFERLSSDAMTRLIADAKTRYDVVLIDCSPALVSGDGHSLANRCDASLLVARAMSETRGLIARLKNELQDNRGEFLGVVVNAVKPSAGGYLKGNIRATHEYTSESAGDRTAA